ncbi:MAG: hypothetical protein KIT22_10140 [Verrucomicrobiae bacterium]|nr:hypothetical protein [Verrucomicrobiae bacterium]
MPVLIISTSQPLPELIFSESLKRVAAVVVPSPLRPEMVTRIVSIGGLDRWKSWPSLAKRWGVWSVFGEEKWGVSETVLSGSRPRGWRFHLLDC